MFSMHAGAGVYAGVLVMALCLPALAFGSSRSRQGQDQPSGQAEIFSITFTGNEALSTTDLRALMTTRETPGFFNKFLYNSISEKLGRKNEYFNPTTFGADIERLKKYYANRGFFEARIDTQLAFSRGETSVDITIAVHEGYRSLIDSLRYKGIVDAPATIWADILASPKISQGDPYNSMLLDDEVKRVLQIFFNTGYPNAVFLQKDSSYAVRYASTRNVSVVLSFSPGKRYLFGPITVKQEADTLRNTPVRDDITDDIVLRHIDYKPGDFYSLEKRISSERNLNRLGVFDLKSIDVNVPPNKDSSIWVTSSITIRPRDKHELAPELIVSNENDAFNLGAGLGYNNRNFFGGARIFSTRVRFRTQTLREFPRYFARNTDAVSNLDLTFELLQPYVFSNKIKGTWSSSYIIEKQKPYRLNIVRNKFGFNDRLADYTTGYLVWTLEAIDRQMNLNFHGDPRDPEIAQQLNLLTQYPRQFNSILSFTIQRDRTNDIFSPSEGFIHSMTVEESGLLPLALKKIIPNLPFTQFYKVNLLGRWYNDLSGHRYSILAFKLKGGFEEKYGESRSDSSRTIPQTDLFYAGGAGSLRGWKSRDLIAQGDPTLAQFGGYFSLESSVELRTNLLQSLHDGFFDKIWIVQFVDMGNLWNQIGNFRVKDIAIDAGLGFRYDTFFGPFRVDWGIRIYNPDELPGQQWITQRKLFGQTFKEGIFHFGIGHAF